MTPMPDDELLSAYLDGEVSPAERAQVEQWLADEPERRQALDELRALGDGLRSLPRAAVGEDLSERVLRRAEVEMLAAPRSKSADVVAPGRADNGHGDHPPLLSYERWRRPAVWAGLALAAGLLIMVAGPLSMRMGPQHKVAINTSDAAPAGAVHDESLHDGEPADSAALDAKPPSIEAGRPPFGVTRSAERSAQPPAPDSVRALAADPSPTVEHEMLRHAGDQPPKPTQLNEEFAPMTASPEVGAFYMYAKTLHSVPSDMLVVELEVAPPAVDEREFHKLLARNDIAWQDQSAEGELQLNRNAANRRFDLYLYYDRQNAPTTPPVANEGRDRDSGVDDLAATIPESGGAEADYDAVMIEASRDQIEGLLRDLNKQNDRFARIVVEPAADLPEQESLLAYQRGAAASGGVGFGTMRGGARGGGGGDTRDTTGLDSAPPQPPLAAAKGEASDTVDAPAEPPGTAWDVTVRYTSTPDDAQTVADETDKESPTQPAAPPSREEAHDGAEASAPVDRRSLREKAPSESANGQAGAGGRLSRSRQQGEVELRAADAPQAELQQSVAAGQPRYRALFLLRKSASDAQPQPAGEASPAPAAEPAPSE